MTTALVRPADAGDIEPVASLLHERMNPRIPRERWRRLMDYPWYRPERERGWVVEDRGRIVGFMGTIHSDRRIGDTCRRFCDLSSWYLLADYRGDGTGDALLQAGMAESGVTYRTMTARRATGRKIRALGFTILDDTRSLFHPRPDATPLRAERDAAVFRARLDEADRLTLDAHRTLDLDQAWLGDRAWIVWQRKLKGDAVSYHEVLYCSDRLFLRDHAQAVADTIVGGERGVLAVDSRWMAGALDPGIVETIALPRWARTVAVAPGDVDHLYSEVLLLDQKLP